jgi:hypothetical protein
MSRRPFLMRVLVRVVVTGLLGAAFALSSAPLHASPARAEETPSYQKLSLSVVGTIYAALYIYTYLAWYRQGSSLDGMHLRSEGMFGASTYAGGADKLGHLWANYAVTRGMSRILEWGGYSKQTALITSTTLAVAFFALVEVKDGYEPRYGFSLGDVLFNAAGNALGAAVELVPAVERRFDFRLEYWPSSYFRQEIKTKGPFNSAEDYTGQRFLISYHLASIDPLHQSRYWSWMEWLDLSLGYQALHYKPSATDPNNPTQTLFVGVSVNVQQILDRTLVPEPGSGRHAGAGVRALRFGTEIVALPFTTLRIGGVSRTGARRPNEQ